MGLLEHLLREKASFKDDFQSAVRDLRLQCLCKSHTKECKQSKIKITSENLL